MRYPIASVTDGSVYRWESKFIDGVLMIDRAIYYNKDIFETVFRYLRWHHTLNVD